MPIYTISFTRNPKIIKTSLELQSISGKFLYFTHDIIIIDESEELFHKDIYTTAKNSQLVTESPIGYGKMRNGEILSWESNFFGLTPLELQPTISRLLTSLP